ncbi:MAG: orotidine-5'-phosphate decarboxylase [Candidatus Kapabacteria bacterium]|nr:orotidine-5'-phosphate decarboxylase [Candidatus Kapabacteria bacterium]
MHFWQKYYSGRSNKNSALCIGLDVSLEYIPQHLLSMGTTRAITEFNRRIIDATRDYAIAYKINLAFYEQYGIEGWHAFEQTRAAIPSDCIVIADAKRADIGNTSKAYATAFFEHYTCDALTVAPYMGRDSIEPFLSYEGRMTFVLALTSNPGSQDFQRLVVGTTPLYRAVMDSTLTWVHTSQRQNLGFVVGATHPEELAELRTYYPHTMFLIPGIGAQGGQLQTALQANANAPALFTISRAILYASSSDDFDDAARRATLAFVENMRNVHIA